MSGRQEAAGAASTPTFSVVICTYNRAAVLPRALGTVLAQTFDDFEVVVVDDGSTDGTVDAIASIPDRRVRYVRQDNAGLGAARNFGVMHSRGQYVAFLDDDDVVLPGWLEGLNAELAREEFAAVCCGEIVADDEDRVLTTNLPMQLGPPFANYTGMFVAGAFAVRRDAYDAAGGFVAGLEDLHHTEFALRLFAVCAANGWRVGTVDRPLLRRHVHAPGEKRFTSEHLLNGTRYVLAHHGEKLARIPGLFARYSSIAGVAAARTGDHREARRLFRQAARSSPRSWRHWARLALAHVPPLGAVVWKTNLHRPPRIDAPADRRRDPSTPDASGS